MNYTITHNTKYEYSDPVPVCHNLVHLQPRSFPAQECKSFRLVVHPEPNDVRQQLDAYGNHVTYFSVEQAHLGLNITSTSEIEVRKTKLATSGVAWDELVGQLRADRSPSYLEAYEFAFPTDRTKPFKDLNAFARESFGSGRPVIDAVKDLTHRIFTEFHYDPRATNVSTPIRTVFSSRRGVCQDFAHLQLACLRGLGLATRYVSGYLRTIPPPGKERAGRRRRLARLGLCVLRRRGMGRFRSY